MGFFDSLRSLLGSKNLNVDARFARLEQPTAGSMSQVIKVRDKKSGQVYALKLLDPGKTAEFELRFKGLNKPSEGEIAVALKHPLLVETVEYGETMSGEPYLLMEYLEGMGLDTMLRYYSSRLTTHRLGLVRQAAEALAAVHQAGYFHRDICPQNLYVSDDGLRLKLFDFGQSVPATPELIAPGNRLIRSAYVAPELLKRSSTTDVRIEVFAFGVTAYQILTGREPWGADVKTSVARMLRRATDIRELRPTLSLTLARAVMSCLASDPKDRPQNMNAFLSMIATLNSEEAH